MSAANLASLLRGQSHGNSGDMLSDVDLACLANFLNQGMLKSRSPEMGIARGSAFKYVGRVREHFPLSKQMAVTTSEFNSSNRIVTDHAVLWQKQLDAGMRVMGLDSSSFQQQQLVAYLGLLLKWNAVYNLTAIREPAHMVSRQLLDSLSILTLVKGPRVLDVGTGAGLPGVPLAIMLPGVEFTLLDTNSKKTRFVNQVKLDLGLANVTVVRQRVEEFHSPAGFDTITSRAFATLADMLRGSRHLLAEHGQWLAMKGQFPGQEITTLDPSYDVRSEVLVVAGGTGERHAIIIQ